MNINEAIQILNKRGFEVKDLKKIDYEIYDEEFSEFMTEEDVLRFANDHKDEEAIK